MKHKVLFFLLLLGVFVSCEQKNKTSNSKRIAKGDVFYGGVFRMNEVEDFRNLFPLGVTEVTSLHIAAQLYEGLVKISQKDLTIIPSLAENWEVNDSATVFTFHLRKGVKFHDDDCFEGGKGREITAYDFKYCFDKLCESSPNNLGFWIFKNKVKGADEYFRSTVSKKPLAGGVSGVKVVDDYILEIDLLYPFAGFINILSTPYTWVFPKEAVDKYGLDMRVKAVGTGPFRLKEVKEGVKVILARNENYWDFDEFGNQLPYLDNVEVSFIKEKKSELLEFKKNNLDMVFQLPIEMIGEVIGDLEEAKEGYNQFQLQITPALNTQYYGFQHENGIFKSKLVRQAFNYAIDRQKIVDFTLQGEGVPAFNGIVPPTFKEYNAEAINGFEYDPDKAKKLLARAGYPDGKGFPTIPLQLNSGGGNRTLVAEVIQKMLKENLNVNIELNVMPFPQHLENIESGKATFWRTGWIADYPDPENFLNLLYGYHVPSSLSERSYINTVRYKNARFDSLFFAAMREVNAEKRNELYRQADQQAMDDAATMPLYYEENYRLLQHHVRNFDSNAMEYRDFKNVYLIPKDKMPAQSREVAKR